MARIIRARLLARAAAPVLLAASLSACSWMPDWVDPTTWMGDSNPPPSSQPAASTADTGAAATGQTPDLADIPAKPAAPSTPEEQKQVTDSLAADRADAHYSAEALRGGTTPAAAPPPPVAANATPGNSATVPSEADAATSVAAETNDEAASAEPATQATASGSAPASQPENGSVSEASAPTSNEIASTEQTPPAAAPVAPIASSASSGMQSTFEPSKAPALDPSVARYVPAQVLSQYRATAAEAASPGIGSDTAAGPSRHRRHRKKTN